jgi:hypothetical protein
MSQRGATTYLATHDFARNPVGCPFDPETFARVLDVGGGMGEAGKQILARG